MKDANLPALQHGAANEQRMNRQVPTEALTYYSRALLYQDRGQKDKAVEMFNRAIAIFPDYAEAKDGLQRVQRS
jgi:Tfp pilus assembly protein PilF